MQACAERSRETSTTRSVIGGGGWATAGSGSSTPAILRCSRRGQSGSQNNSNAANARYGNTPIELTRKEFALLEALMRRPGEAVSRFDLLECAWDDSYDNRSNIVDVYIGYLRQKVDRPFGTESIETVRGFGYRLRTEETE